MIETTLFTFPSPSSASGWFRPFGAGVKAGKSSLDTGQTGPYSAYRQARDNYELRFAVGRYVRWNPRLMARVQVFKARKPG